MEEYRPCEGVNPDTLKPNGNWHYCCITTSTRGQQLVYPIGYCRKNKCVHKTPEEAALCFHKYECEIDARFFTGEDTMLPDGKIMKGREVEGKCLISGEPCKSYCVVGLENKEYYLCREHATTENLKKLHPVYKINFVKND